MPQKTPSKARLASSLENEETELGMSALELLDDSPNSSENTLIKELDRTKGSSSSAFNEFSALQNEEDEDKSSVYSHPSMLDGGLNFMVPFRPNYSPILASTPENSYLNDPPILGPPEELSTEVNIFSKN